MFTPEQLRSQNEPREEHIVPYGLLAEFEDTDGLMHAVHRLRADGYTRINGYTPFPVKGLSEALGQPKSHIPAISFLGGLLGGCTAYGVMYYASVISYPINVGGRPLHSWPSFIPITFELTILGAALSAFFGMLALNGLPRPYHPLFNVPEFKLVSRDRFFLCIQSDDPHFDLKETRRAMESVSQHVYEVPA